MSMTNEDIKNLMNDTHNIFFKKWRNHIPNRADSVEWDLIIADINKLLRKYENNEPAKQIVLWFL